MKNGAFHFLNNDSVQKLWIKSWFYYCHNHCHEGNIVGNGLKYVNLVTITITIAVTIMDTIHVAVTNMITITVTNKSMSRGCHVEPDRNEKISVKNTIY